MPRRRFDVLVETYESFTRSWCGPKRPLAFGLRSLHAGALPVRIKHGFALFLGLTLLGVLAVVGMKYLRLGPLAAGPRDAPVVIFVIIDTVRADRTSLCGYERPTTPNLEAIVEGGATYACNSHAPSTWTLPSHASFFTGVGLDQHKSGGGGGGVRMKTGAVTPLGPELPTLAEEMSARGYQTLLLSGNPVVSGPMGLTRGFDHVAVGRTFPMMHDHRLAEWLEEKLRVARLDPRRPLFAFINIADPHSPWTGIPPGVGFLPRRSRMRADPERTRYESRAMNEDEAAQYLAHLSDVYDYAIYRADRSLGLVLEVLGSHGWLDHSYRLVITSDHGEYLGEHGMIEHGRPFFYEPITQVPFLYYSTDGELPLPADVPAIAAHALVRDGGLPERLSPGFAAVFRNPDPATEQRPPCTAARAALWQGGTRLVADRGRVVRFDLTSDPEETAPVPADDDPLAKRLLAHCSALDRAFASRPISEPERDAALTEQLKALGYLRDDEPELPEATPDRR